jgi:hypothetical protein
MTSEMMMMKKEEKLHTSEREKNSTEAKATTKCDSYFS